MFGILIFEVWSDFKGFGGPFGMPFGVKILNFFLIRFLIDFGTKKGEGPAAGADPLNLQNLKEFEESPEKILGG